MLVCILFGKYIFYLYKLCKPSLPSSNALLGLFYSCMKLLLISVGEYKSVNKLLIRKIRKNLYSISIRFPFTPDRAILENDN